jgi:hypothetical protein
MDEVGKSYEPTGKFVMRQIVDEVLLVPVSPDLKQRDTLLVLNESAAAMYSQVAAGKSFPEIESWLCDQFEGAAARLREDYRGFVESMFDLEVIRERGRA